MSSRLVNSLIAFFFAAAAAAAENPTVITLSPSAVAGLERTSATVHVHGSAAEAKYEGVTLRSLLTKNQVPSGEAIRGGKLTMVVVVKAADNYSAVFALAELDPAFSDKLFLLADRKNGQPLPEAEGPFRIVIPGEKRQARWVRQVVSITGQETR